MYLRKTKLLVKKVSGFFSAPFIIKQYLNQTPAGQRKLILGGHWSDHHGWLVLNEEHQDITKKLKIPSKTFDVIFLEHVFEHIKFNQAVFFLKEARRVLRKNGTLRIVSPFLDKIVSINLDSKNRNDRIYIKNNLIRLTYPEIDKQLKSLGLKGINGDSKTFYLNSLFREQGHWFIWSSHLLKTVMESLGFKRVTVYNPGFGHKKEYCIERRQRGIYTGYDWREDVKAKKIYDQESLAVEGIK